MEVTVEEASRASDGVAMEATVEGAAAVEAAAAG